MFTHLRLPLALFLAALVPALILANDSYTHTVAAQVPPPVLPVPIGMIVRERSEWLFQQRAYPLGDIPDLALVHAFEQAQASQAMSGSDLKTETGSWINLGPAPLLGGQIGMTAGTRPMSGRVSAVAVDPSNPHHWAIGAAQGGVWDTYDAGGTWTPRTDDQPSLAIGAIAFAPSNPSVIYAGTGEFPGGASAHFGQGLLKSIDGGISWTLLATPTFAKTSFSAIKVNSDSSGLLVVATEYGLAGRDGGYAPTYPPRGVLTSIDGGVSWTRKLAGDASDLAVDPANFNHEYAGLGNIFGQQPNGVFRSLDGGNTWTRISGPWEGASEGVGRIQLALAPSDPDVLYVSIQDAINGSGHDDGLLGLWRTTNAWAIAPTWTRISTAAIDGGFGYYGYCDWDIAFSTEGPGCGYAHKIIVDGSNPSVLYAGGAQLWRLNGTTWTEVSKQVADPANGIHADQQAMAWAGPRLIVGNDDGVWSTTDAGNTWQDHNTNLSTIQFYNGSLHPVDASVLLSGSQDNGTSRRNQASTWRMILGGDGFSNAFSASRPNLNWAASSQYLNILRTRNGGSSWTSMDNGIDDNWNDGSANHALFGSPLKKCPAKDDVFIAGTDHLWRTNRFFSDANPAWAANSPMLGVDSRGVPIQVSAVAFAPTDTECRTYAFGTRTGLLWLTRDGGDTWTDLNPASSVPDRWVTDLAFSPVDANVLLVALSGFDEGTPLHPGHLFSTADALSSAPTWYNVGPPVNIPVNTIAFGPDFRSTLYAGTDFGLWRSDTSGSSWVQIGPEMGIPYVAVFDVQTNAATGNVVAFTHGRGAFALALPFTATRTATPTATLTRTLTPSPTPNASLTPTLTPTLTPSPTPTVSNTSTPTSTLTSTLTASPTPRPSNTPTPTPTLTPFAVYLPLLNQ